MLLRTLSLAVIAFSLLGCVSHQDREVEVEIEKEGNELEIEVEANRPVVVNRIIPIKPASEHQSADSWLRNEICANFDQIALETRFSPPDAMHELQKLYNQAHEHNPKAQAAIADHYVDGKAVPKDWRKALCWYRTAAGNGSAYAQYWLGIFYQYGFVVEESESMATYWFNRAGAHANHVAAEAQVGDRYADDSAGIQDMGQALFWWERAAAKRNLDAELALGNFYADSNEAADIHRALSWYGKAVEQHSTVAAYNIGQIYYHGKGIPVDYAQAHKWFLKAAHAGYAPAQYNLSDMYYNGLGVKQDWIQAYAWLATSKAADNNPSALKLQDTLIIEFTPEQLNQANNLANNYKKRYGH